LKVTKSNVRRERMGHINLATPVCSYLVFKISSKQNSL